VTDYLVAVAQVAEKNLNCRIAALLLEIAGHTT